ncbi:MAG: P1 family peptidase [Pseudomonadota bacterium]
MTDHKTRKKRARELGLPFPGVTGPANAITDVGGVKVGYKTLIEGDGPLVVGEGPVRTGVTAILPRGHAKQLSPVWAGMENFNGNGELTGSHWVQQAGYFYGPICITNSHSVGAVHEGVIRWVTEKYYEEVKELFWILPVVGETFDGILNDINGFHVRPEHAIEAISSAKSGPIAEGNVGGGTGMRCYAHKGGNGTSSRRLQIGANEYTVGAFVQANFGRLEDLTVLGAPIGRELAAESSTSAANLGAGHGSIIVVIATDIPLGPKQLDRMAKRVTLGLGRTGTPGQQQSGDVFIAFSTAEQTIAPKPSNALVTPTIKDDEEPFDTLTCLVEEQMTPVFEAVVQSTEEAIINAMIAAEDMTGRDGNFLPALDQSRLMTLIKKYAII